MTTFILLALLVYVWAIAVVLMAELDDGWRFWDRYDWLLYVAYPITVPGAILFMLSLDVVYPRAVKVLGKLKDLSRDLIDWLKGKYPL